MSATSPLNLAREASAEALAEAELLRPPVARLEHLRRRLGALVVDNFFLGASLAGKAVPLARPRLHGVEVLRDIPYRDTGLPEHLLDIYRPLQRGAARPVVLYIHGGGFRILSKETHWIFGLLFARRGYVVCTINYRLAPQNPFLAALEDASAAYAWVVEHAARFGGDPSRLVIAGESAGANLAVALTLESCYRRPEPFAQQVFDTGVVPSAVLPASGYLQVSDPERFARTGRMPWFLLDRLTEVTDAYLHGLRMPGGQVPELVDPLLMVEKGTPPDRPLPPFFTTCGTGDHLVEDTERLTAALSKLGVRAEMSLFPREPHAFHAFVVKASARRHWRETFHFLDSIFARGQARPTSRGAKAVKRA